MCHNNKSDLKRILTNFIKSQEELTTFKSINIDVIQTLQSCFYYSIDEENLDKVSDKLFEIETVLDYLQDELNTGHWSEVPIHIRQCFTSASFIKCLITLKCTEILSLELLQKCLKCLDMGLLLGAPLDENFELLTKSARYLSKEINTLQQCDSKKPQTETHKRKYDNEYNIQFDKLNAVEIDAVDCPSLEYFHKNYFLTQTPVKLKDCMNHWPATKKWLDVNYLLSIAGDRTVPIEIGSRYTDENWSQKLMTLRDFIYKHYLEDTTDIGYLAQHNLFEQITELKEDICVPEYCCLSEDYENCTEPDINAWFGPKGTVSPLHYDPKNNILAQVYGTKRLLLFSPSDTTFLYPHEGKMLCNTARVDPLTPDLKEYPEFSKSKMFKCLLEPGEMLYLPPKWWHHVTALEKSFSVSFWWK